MAIDRLHNSSVDMQRLLGELITHYRNLMIIKTVKSSKLPIVCSVSQLNELKAQAETYDIRDIMRVLTVLQEATAAMQTGNRRCEMEMAVIKLCNPQAFSDLSALEKRIRALENGTVDFKQPEIKTELPEKPVAEPENTDEEEIPLPEAPDELPAQVEPKQTEKAVSQSGISRVESWNEIIRLLRTSCPPIAGVLENSSAYIK